MITNLINKHPTPLQVAIGVAIKEKELIKELYSFGVVCSYDEVLRFRKSEAMASKLSLQEGWFMRLKKALILFRSSWTILCKHIKPKWFTIDACISHVTIMTLTDTTVHGDASSSQTIRRIKKEEMTVQIDDDPQMLTVSPKS